MRQPVGRDAPILRRFGHGGADHPGQAGDGAQGDRAEGQKSSASEWLNHAPVWLVRGFNGKAVERDFVVVATNENAGTACHRLRNGPSAPRRAHDRVGPL